MTMNSNIISSITWIGKKLYQSGQLTITYVLPAIVEGTAKIILNSDKTTDEQKARAKQNLVRYGKHK